MKVDHNLAPYPALPTFQLTIQFNLIKFELLTLLFLSYNGQFNWELLEVRPNQCTAVWQYVFTGKQVRSIPCFSLQLIKLTKC